MTTDEERRNQVAALSSRGYSKRRIAKELGISRNTVRRILNQLALQRGRGHSILPGAPKRRGQKLDEHVDFIREQLEEYSELTAVRVHEMLGEKGIVCGYTVVKDKVRELRPRAKRSVVTSFETEPGKQGQQDWSPYDIPFTVTGLQKMSAFSLVLGYSRRQCLRFCYDERFITLIREHQAAFERFDGVPEEILYDGQKAVVLKREAGRPIYNPRFLCFATHYGFRPVALPPRRPDLKGKVERPFDYVKKNLLGGRKFRTPEHLAEVTEWWLENRADVRIHSKLKERPIDRFIVEARHLLPLPGHPYDTAEIGYRIVSVEGTVYWDVTPYSVPPEYLLDMVYVRVTEQEVFIYDSKLKEIARHEKAPAGQRDPVSNPAHRPKNRTRHDIDTLVERMMQLGEAGEVFATGVCQRQRYRGSHLSQVLGLVERYSADDLLLALERANRYRAFDAGVVLRILEANASPRALPEVRLDSARTRLSSMLPSGTPRSLDDYAAALKGVGLDDEEKPDEKEKEK